MIVVPNAEKDTCVENWSRPGKEDDITNGWGRHIVSCCPLQPPSYTYTPLLSPTREQGQEWDNSKNVQAVGQQGPCCVLSLALTRGQ